MQTRYHIENVKTNPLVSQPALTIQASDKYSTTIEIHLPTEQRLRVWISPDYENDACIEIQLT